MSSNCFVKSKRVSTNTIDGFSFIYLEDTKETLQLDEVASFIWNQINGVKNVSEIIDNCTNHFEGDPSEIRTSVSEFFNTLISEKLIKNKGERQNDYGFKH